MSETVLSREIENHPVCETDGGKAVAPCTIVIFGASGDLAARKLIPSLLQLYAASRLPDPITIIGASRSVMDEQQFRSHLQERVKNDAAFDEELWRKFAANLFYHPLQYDDENDFRRLADLLRRLDSERKTAANTIFYLAVPPSVYGLIGVMLGKSGLSRENSEGIGWSRIVVEKPFGSDLESALALDQSLHSSFAEHQIFRIDHYLAKETVQNILMFRFANAIFEPVWNRSYVDYIGILAAEKLGVEHRAGYYEQAGVIRDMFQNHMMQLLALTAMEPPSVFTADRVQDEKVKVFRSLKPFKEARQEDNLILGQYGPGHAEGQQIIGYRQQKRPSGQFEPLESLNQFVHLGWNAAPSHLMLLLF